MSNERLALHSVVCKSGQPWPMGARCMTLGSRTGVNFAVYAPNATTIEVCLYDESGLHETARRALPQCSNGIWHGFVPDIVAGQLYGLRAHGPYQPATGQRFNPAKLLIDPFARALVGDCQTLSLEVDYVDAEATAFTTPHGMPDPQDNAQRIPKARVLDWEQEWQAGAVITPGPRTPLTHTVLYEAHVKGLTQRHPDVPQQLRGTYAGLVTRPMLEHYQRLGITTLSLLPVQLHITEAHLLKKGLSNYWGYNTLGFFVPHPNNASGLYPSDRAEFRYMVDQLHRNGLEVVLDVVFNHSAESDTLGPTLSWRGLDNASWYVLDATGQYINHSGCGNSLNLAHPRVIQWVMDCLRWWVQAYGVDGFRFDLATALGRDPALGHAFNPLSALLCAIEQDPLLAGIKLIAEPWDVGPNGYQLGQFPGRWLEWNDRYRDTCRAYWLGFDCTRGALARRLTGSSDYFQHRGRSPQSSVNLVTAHDGMTLADLSAYQHKHNDANGEGNRDGHDHNLSANAGAEGPTNDAAVLAVRGQWRRALLSTLFCSQGVPQLLAGDEFGNSQGGNNNAYCQDNETGTLDWPDTDADLIGFVSKLIHLRHRHAALRTAGWFSGQGDIAWRAPDGGSLSDAQWEDPHALSFACLIEGVDCEVMNPDTVERWLLIFHPTEHDCPFVLPAGPWLRVLDSAASLVLPEPNWEQAIRCTGTLRPSARTVVGLVQKRGQQ